MSTGTVINLVMLHGTIISIFAAVGFGYFFYTLRRRRELLIELFEEADKVNEIQGGSMYYGTKKKALLYL